MRLAVKIAFIIFIAITLGCAPKHEIKTQTVSGTYNGLTSEGDQLTLTIKQLKHGFRGQGTLNGDPIVISGVKTWSSIGTIMFSDGSSSLVRLRLRPGIEDLIIEPLGKPEIVLNQGGTPVSFPPGPFTGKYRPTGQGSSFGSAKIVQIGSLIVGNAEIFDQPTSITGRVVSPNKAVGQITYIDESKVSFEAEISADGKTITFLGMGEPILLEKF